MTNHLKSPNRQDGEVQILPYFTITQDGEIQPVEQSNITTEGAR